MIMNNQAVGLILLMNQERPSPMCRAFLTLTACWMLALTVECLFLCLQESLLEELRPPLSKEEWDKIIHSSPTSAESTMRIFDTCAEWVEQKYMPSATAEIRTKVSHAISIMLTQGRHPLCLMLLRFFGLRFPTRSSR